MKAERRGFSLVEILVVLVIILVLLAIIAPRLFGTAKRPVTQRPQSVLQEARSTECINNLSQLRQAQRLAAVQDDEQRPQSLREIGRGFPESMFSCPVGKQPHSYDPASGRIACTYPGHERY